MSNQDNAASQRLMKQSIPERILLMKQWSQFTLQYSNRRVYLGYVLLGRYFGLASIWVDSSECALIQSVIPKVLKCKLAVNVIMKTLQKTLIKSESVLFTYRGEIGALNVK